MTLKLTDTKEVIRDNSACGSLAILYDKIWNKRQSDLVFVPHDVTRDEPKESRAGVVVRERVTQLTWLVEEDCPLILKAYFKLKGVLIRDEYRFILAAIWNIISEGDGRLSGYLPQPDLWKTDADSPPHNPFVGLTIKWSGEDEVPGVIVTGTPGIGKSAFLLVVLALRLLAGLTTVYHETWFLVDSNKGIIEPPQSFIDACNSSSRKLIIAASPRKNRFDFTSKDMCYRTVWMNPFSFAEYIEARGLQGSNTLPCELDLETFFQLYGPSARAAFSMVTKPDNYKNILQSNIDWISSTGIEKTLRNINQGYFENQFSQLVFVAKRLHDKPYDFYVEFASRFITELVLDAFMRQDTENGYKIYRQLLKMDYARACAGNLLEALCLNRLPLGGQWRMRRMKINKKHSLDQVDEHWVVDKSSPLFTLLIGQEGFAVEIAPGERCMDSNAFSGVDRHEYGRSTDPSANEQAGFYIPVGDNQSSFDAWIYESSTKHTVVLQCIIEMTTLFIQSKGVKWSKEHTVDVIIVSDEEGGMDITTPYTESGLIRNVYRLVY
ncbi:hypothetical protein ACEPAG_2325 [Sanghuangporus baumii]